MLQVFEYLVESAVRVSMGQAALEVVGRLFYRLIAEKAGKGTGEIRE